MKVKRITALLLCCLLVVSMAFTAMVSVSAADAVPPVVDTEQTGTINITKKLPNNEGTVAGAKYTAYQVLSFDGKIYKLLDAYSAAGITVESIVKKGTTTNELLTYGTTSELEAQISQIQAVADKQTGKVSEATNPEGKTSISGLALGVYLVVETTPVAGHVVHTQPFLIAIPEYVASHTEKNEDDGTETTVAATWKYALDVEPKNSKMTIDKTFKEKDGTNNTSEDTFEIGDTIEFTVDADIPDYGYTTDYPYPDYQIKATDYTATVKLKDNANYGLDLFNGLNPVFKDTLTKGLSYVKDSIKIVVVNGSADGTTDVELTNKGTDKDTLTALASATFTEDKKVTLTNTDGGKDYLVTFTDGNKADNSTLQLDLSWAVLNQYQGKKLRLTYKAVLNEEAQITAGDNNTIDYTYSQDPKYSTDTLKRDTITDNDNKIYTFKMDLTKKFNGATATDAKVDATQVKFQLNKVGNAVEKYSFIKNADGNYTIWTNADKTGKTIVTEINPAKDGSLIVKGLSDGTYNLVETETVNGYVLLTSPVTIKITEHTDDNKLTGKADAEIDIMTNGNKVTQALENGSTTDLGTFKITVNNPKSQFTLPSTGGLGIWMFSIGAAVVLAGAIILFTVARKKRSK